MSHTNWTLRDVDRVTFHRIESTNRVVITKGDAEIALDEVQYAALVAHITRDLLGLSIDRCGPRAATGGTCAGTFSRSPSLLAADEEYPEPQPEGSV